MKLQSIIHSPRSGGRSPRKQIDPSNLRRPYRRFLSAPVRAGLPSGIGKSRRGSTTARFYRQRSEIVTRKAVGPLEGQRQANQGWPRRGPPRPPSRIRGGSWVVDAGELGRLAGAPTELAEPEVAETMLAAWSPACYRVFAEWLKLLVRPLGASIWLRDALWARFSRLTAPIWTD